MGIMRSVSGAAAKKVMTNKDGKIRVIMFKANWCQYCQETGVQINQLAPSMKDIEFFSIDYGKNEDLCDKYVEGDEVGIPYTVIMRKGKVLDAWEGYINASDLESLIEAVR